MPAGQRRSQLVSIAQGTSRMHVDPKRGASISTAGSTGSVISASQAAPCSRPWARPSELLRTSIWAPHGEDFRRHECPVWAQSTTTIRVSSCWLACGFVRRCPRRSRRFRQRQRRRGSPALLGGVRDVRRRGAQARSPGQLPISPASFPASEFPIPKGSWKRFRARHILVPMGISGSVFRRRR
jgi:hypothetical protein